MPDAQSILTPLQIPTSVKADAFDAYTAAKSPDDLATRLQKLPLAQSVKADLWDAKNAEGGAVAAPSPAQDTGFLHNAGQLIGGVVDSLNPLPAIQKYAIQPALDVAQGFHDRNLSQFAQGVQRLNPANAMASDIVNAQAAQGQQALDLVKQGRYTEAVGHGVAAALPVLGPAAAQAGETIGQGIESGDTGQVYRGIGQGVGLIGGVLAPHVLPAPADVAATLSKIPAPFKNPNAQEAAAFNYLRSKGVNVDAGTASGNTFLRGATALADTSPLGAVVSRNAQIQNIGALKDIAEGFVNDATPETPAEQHYSQFREAVDDPANARDVPILDRNGNRTTGPDGNIATQSVQMPVKVGELKPTLAPIAESMSWMTPSDLSKSPGYSAILKILHGPDFISAGQAEMGLSGIKREAREGSDLRSIGLMKFVGPKLQQMIDDSVGAVGGDDALAALQRGRKAAAMEAGASWLSDEFKKAEAEGGFNRAAGLWADWQRLPDEQKAGMFRPDQVSDLDKFFLGVKKMQQPVNTSGTALVTNVGAQGALLGHNPIAGISTILGTGALSKLLHSDFGVRLLTEGLAGRPTDSAELSKIIDGAEPPPVPPPPVPPQKYPFVRMSDARDLAGDVGEGFQVHQIPIEKLYRPEDISGDATKQADVSRYTSMFRAGSEPPALFGRVEQDNPTGNIILSTGSRRLAAAKAAGVQSLPVAISNPTKGAYALGEAPSNPLTNAATGPIVNSPNPATLPKKPGIFGSERGSFSMRPKTEAEVTPANFHGPASDELLAKATDALDKHWLDHEVLGLRLQSGNEVRTKIGDVLRPSSHWIDGTKTRNKMAGTAAFIIPREDRLPGVLDSMMRSGYRGMAGDRIVLVGGDDVDSDGIQMDEPNSGIVKRAKVLAVIHQH